MLLQKYKKEDMHNINKIGIIMFGLFGDVLLRTPVIRALKDIYPNAQIVAIVDTIGEIVLSNNDYVDKIILLKKDKSNKLKNNINKLNCLLAIRDEKFDLLVNLYNGGSSPFFVFLSNARYKLGFCNQDKEYIYNVYNECSDDRLKDEQTLNSYMISIVEPLSSKKYSLKPVFDIKKTIENEIKEYLLNFDYDINKVYTLNLGSSKENKMLENEKYLYLIKYIYDKYGFLPAIISNPGQEYLQNNFINDFLEPQNIPFIKLDELSLEKVASVINLTKFIITPDTGLMHLAMAFDTFIYTIFVYTHPIFVDPQNNQFISVYDYFDEEKLYQHQDISTQTLVEKIDILFKRLS